MTLFCLCFFFEVWILFFVHCFCAFFVVWIVFFLWCFLCYDLWLLAMENKLDHISPHNFKNERAENAHDWCFFWCFWLWYDLCFLFLLVWTAFIFFKCIVVWLVFLLCFFLWYDLCFFSWYFLWYDLCFFCALERRKSTNKKHKKMSISLEKMKLRPPDLGSLRTGGPANVSHHSFFQPPFLKTFSGVSPCHDRECEKMYLSYDVYWEPQQLLLEARLCNAYNL